MTGGPTLRAFAIGVTAIVMALGAALIGGNLWPRVERVEQKVVAPAVNAVTEPRPAAGDDLADMIAVACPAIVAIDQGEGATTGDGAAAGLATALPRRPTGFIASPDGYVVVSDRALAAGGALRVLLSDGRALDARRIGDDPLSGIALLKIDGSNFSSLSFADASLPPVGTETVALAAPEARGCIADPAMVSGDFASGRPGARAFVRLRPTPDDAFAGAPVLDRNGRVVGIVGLGGAASGTEADASLLLPGATASRVFGALLRSDGGATNDFGFVAQDLSPALAARIGTERQQGAMIALIAPGSAAARAGLQAGDVIFTANGTPVANATELSRALDGTDDTVTLDVMRRADRISIAMRRH